MAQWLSGTPNKLTDNGHHQLIERVSPGNALDVGQVVDEAVGIRHQRSRADLYHQGDRTLGENVLERGSKKSGRKGQAHARNEVR